jgi:hypothetical protein
VVPGESHGVLGKLFVSERPAKPVTKQCLRLLVIQRQQIGVRNQPHLRRLSHLLAGERTDAIVSALCGSKQKLPPQIDGDLRQTERDAVRSGCDHAGLRSFKIVDLKRRGRRV